MKLSTSSILAVCVLAFTMPAFADRQIRRRNRRILAEVAWDRQERILEEPLMEDAELVDFSMELSVELSLSMSMQYGSTKTKSTRGSMQSVSRGSMQSVVTTGGSDADGSIPEVPLEVAIDHKVLMKRNYVEDTHAAMKLVKP